MKKNILLIGGSYGIGAAIAAKLKKEHQVITASRTNEGISEGIVHHTFDVLNDDIESSTQRKKKWQKDIP